MQASDLMCAVEIAEELGVQPSAVSNWRNRPATNFPEPWGEWKSGALWLRDDIETWWADREAAKLAARERSIARHEAALRRLKAA